MPKMIREGQEIYLAPQILGVIREGRAIAIDEKNNNEELDPTDIDSKIIIYERQVKGWFLDRASRLLSSGDNDFIVLMVCMSYFEGVEQYRQGCDSNGSSAKMFKDAIQNLYRDSDFTRDNLENLYKEARCGLFHDGMVRGKIILKNSFSPAISFIGNDIQISPRKLLNDIKKDFRDYIKKLKDINSNERVNFDAKYEIPGA